MKYLLKKFAAKTIIGLIIGLLGALVIQHFLIEGISFGAAYILYGLVYSASLGITFAQKFLAKKATKLLSAKKQKYFDAPVEDEDMEDFEIELPPDKMKVKDDSLNVALEYLEKADFSSLTRENYWDFFSKHPEISNIMRDWSEDLRITQLRTTQSEELGVFTVALYIKLEEVLTGTSTYEIAKALIAEYESRIPENFEKWLDTEVPKNLMEEFIEKALEFAKDNNLPWIVPPSDVMTKGEMTCHLALLCAWHEGEEIEV